MLRVERRRSAPGSQRTRPVVRDQQHL